MRKEQLVITPTLNGWINIIRTRSQVYPLWVSKTLIFLFHKYQRAFVSLSGVLQYPIYTQNCASNMVTILMRNIQCICIYPDHTHILCIWSSCIPCMFQDDQHHISCSKTHLLSYRIIPTQNILEAQYCAWDLRQNAVTLYLIVTKSLTINSN